MQNNRYRRILLLFLCFLMLFICSCGKAPADVRIYNDIKECYAIEDQQYESIVIYSSPSEDKNIKGLTYEAFYGCEIKNSDFAFEFLRINSMTAPLHKHTFQQLPGSIAISPQTILMQPVLLPTAALLLIKKKHIFCTATKHMQTQQ